MNKVDPQGSVDVEGGAAIGEAPENDMDANPESSPTCINVNSALAASSSLVRGDDLDNPILRQIPNNNPLITTCTSVGIAEDVDAVVSCYDDMALQEVNPMGRKLS